MLDILYEDESLIFVNKPPNLIVQRAFDPLEPVLFDLVAAVRTPLYLMQRLDRGTSGVMFFSRNSKVNARLTRQFERREIEKRYIALCAGTLAERQTVDAPLRRIGAIKFAVGRGGKRAVTSIDPIEHRQTASLIALRLHTGRTHQIRVHLGAIGHPLIGDWLYGNRRDAPRPMLHALELVMPHPLTRVKLTVRAAPPADFREAAAAHAIGVV